MKEIEKSLPSDLFEGMTSIRALLLAIDRGLTDRKIVKVLFAEEERKKKNGELRYLKARSCELGFELTLVPLSDINERTLGTSHGGIIAYCSERTIPALPEQLPSDGYYVYLDGIEDPYNFGYALRSLYASGVDGILMPERNWMGCAGVVCRASAGASELVNLYQTDDISREITVMRKNGYRIICSDLPESVSVYDADLKKPLLLVIGGEKRGIKRSVLQMADTVVRIPYGRDFQGALSAASAAAVLGFEVLRQNLN